MEGKKREKQTKKPEGDWTRKVQFRQQEGLKGRTCEFRFSTEGTLFLRPQFPMAGLKRRTRRGRREEEEKGRGRKNAVKTRLERCRQISKARLGV